MDLSLDGFDHAVENDGGRTRADESRQQNQDLQTLSLSPHCGNRPALTKKPPGTKDGHGWTRLAYYP